MPVEFVQDDAGLNGHRIGVDRENVSQMPREVDDDACSQASASDAASSTSRKHIEFSFVRVLDDRDDIIPGSGPCDRQRLDLVEAGVTGVKTRRERIDEQFAVEHAAQVLDHPLALLFHACAAPEGLDEDFVVGCGRAIIPPDRLVPVMGRCHRLSAVQKRWEGGVAPPGGIARHARG